jgi:hypothetical protein
MSNKPTVTRRKAPTKPTPQNNVLEARLARKRVEDEDRAPTSAIEGDAVASDKTSEDVVSAVAESGPDVSETPEDVLAVEGSSALAKVVADLQAKIDALESASRGPVIEGDEFFYLAESNGVNWSERKVVNQKYVDVQFTMTNFFGPFASAEERDIYLNAKLKRGDNNPRWRLARPVSGEERRKMLIAERADLELRGATAIPLPV